MRLQAAVCRIPANDAAVCVVQPHTSARFGLFTSVYRLAALHPRLITFSTHTGLPKSAVVLH